jgi:hypothetical protein
VLMCGCGMSAYVGMRHVMSKCVCNEVVHGHEDEHAQNKCVHMKGCIMVICIRNGHGMFVFAMSSMHDES